jgi:hypothetical protein
MFGFSRISTIRVVEILALTACLAFPLAASSQCAGAREDGRWRNVDANGDPLFIDVKTVGGCSDEVLNGQPSGGTTHYTLRVWVKQSSGQMYGRAAVKAAYRNWNGKQWLQGNVSTGGYQDQMWMRVEPRNGQNQLRVIIKHQSLDSKPSSQSEYWYAKA